MARFVKLSRDEWTRPGERNDCTVRALAVAGNLSYEEAYRIMARAGRKKNRGSLVHRAFPYRNAWSGKRVKRRGIELVERITPWPRITIASFLDKNRKGRFIISSRRHAMAVIDGAIYDLWTPRESTKLDTILVLKVPRRRKKKLPELALAA